MSITESQKQVLELFQDIDEPVLTASEIADEFGITQQAAYSRLKRLHEDGLIDRKEVGARAVAWWPVEDQSSVANC